MEHALPAPPQGIAQGPVVCQLPPLLRIIEHMNAAASQHCEGAKEQHQSRYTRIGAQVAIVDDYQ